MNKWSKLIGRRSFLMRGSLIAEWVALTGLSARPAFAATHRYKLAPESLLPADVLKAPFEVREAYRFAIGSRGVLRYIPCYCGCGEQGIRAMLLVIFKTTQRRKSRYSIE